MFRHGSCCEVACDFLHELIYPVIRLVFNGLHQQMTAITGKFQGHFSSVQQSAAPSGKQGVRWCQKNAVRGQIPGRRGLNSSVGYPADIAFHYYALLLLPGEYGPKNRTPLKWIRCEGESATHTSVSQAISFRYRLMIERFGKAVT